MVDNKKIDYKTIAELKALLVDTIRAENYDIPLQASKVLAYIYGDKEKKALADIFNSKIYEFNALMKKQGFYGLDEFYYNLIKNILENQKIKIYETYDLHKLFKIPFEYTNFIAYIYESISKSEDFSEKYNNNIKNIESIYLGIFEYYMVLFTKLRGITIKDININLDIRKQIAPIYDYYYLKQKCIEQINDKYNYSNETILLKIATIKVLSDFIQYLQNNEIVDIYSKILTRKEYEIFKCIKNNMNATAKEIAKAMDISPNTITSHFNSIALKITKYERLKNPNIEDINGKLKGIKDYIAIIE